MLNFEKNVKLTFDDVADALEYINNYWQELTCIQPNESSTIIPLPNPYIIPSVGNDDFSFGEQYYWDSYFSCLGHDDELIATGMLDNLIYLYNKFKIIPNANRYYFLGRSQPPILTTYIFHIYEKYGKSKEWLNEHIKTAEDEYLNVWVNDEHPHDRNVYQGLSRYYDINRMHDLAEAESGWDMTPRFKRQCLDYLPIDLNCLLYKYETDFAKTANINGKEAEESSWLQKAKNRKEVVDKLMWNNLKGMYFDYNYIEGKKSSVWSLAAYYALWSGLADKQKAQKLVKNLDRFVKKGGLTTTVGNVMYASLFGSAKTQWAYPNGWAPLHFLVISGLEDYGYDEQAKEIAYKWLRNCNDTFNKQGVFKEKYNVVNPNSRPVEGLYPTQLGFGWTNGVFSYLANKYLL